MGLAGAGWSEEDDVLAGGDEVQGAQVGDDVAVQAAGVVEVELFQGFAGGEPGGPDPSFTAVGLPSGDLSLQAGGEELLEGPGGLPGSVGQPRDRLAQRGRLQRAGEELQLTGHIPGGGLGSHQIACPSWSYTDRSRSSTSSTGSGRGAWSRA